MKRSRSWIYTKHEEAVKAFEQGNEEFLNRWVIEQIFDTFIGLAAYAIKYPSENYTIYWQKLDEYEEDAILELLKATLIIDDQTQERINEIEAQRIERNNEKNKGKTPDFFHGATIFS